MRIVHFSDTHLGFSNYFKVDPSDGMNIREKDFYDAFRQAVDKAIELKPDAVVHSGDLFDTWKPLPKALDFAMRQLIRLSEAGIETVLISGNHSTPRVRAEKNVFRLFEHWKHLHPVYEPGVRAIQVGDMTIHALPHSSEPPLSAFIPRMKPSSDTSLNVAVLHIGLLSKKLYKMDEFNEQAVKEGSLPEGFDYIALGHYHEHDEVKPGICYSGSTERLSISEAEQPKGIVEVDLPSGKTTFHELRVRRMVDMEPVDASKMSASEIASLARDRIGESDVDDCIVRMTIKNIPPEAFRALDAQAIKRFARSALHFELSASKQDVEGVAGESSLHIGSLSQEYEVYVGSLAAPEEKRKMLLDRGRPYFGRCEE